jgi:transcription-repair coupling factor (superfamily II helicase)
MTAQLYKNPDDSILESIQNNTGCVEISGVEGSARAFFLSRLVRKLHRPVWIVMPTLKICQRFADDFNFFSGHLKHPEVVVFPPYNILPFKRMSYHNETAAQRVRTLYRLTVNSEPFILAAPVETLLQRVMPRHVLCDFTELVMKGEEIDRDALIQKLGYGGYTQTSLVEEPGEYSIRGGILDVYTSMYDDPLRIEFFGDMVESIRFFSSVTQRRIKDVDEALILPAREATLHKSRMDEIARKVQVLVRESGIAEQNAEKFLDRIEREGVFSGIESFLPLIYPELDTVFNYVPDNAVWIQFDPGDIEKEAVASEEIAIKNYITACSDDRLCVKPEQLYQKREEVLRLVNDNTRLAFRLLPTGYRASGNQRTLSFQFSVHDNSAVTAELTQVKQRENVLLPLHNWIDEKQRSGYLTLLVCSTESQSKRLSALLEPYGIQTGLVSQDAAADLIRGKSKGTRICTGRISGGFVWPDEQLAVIYETEIFGAKISRKKPQRDLSQVKTELLDFTELNVGDFIVHIDHGIGIYDGLVKIRIEGVTNDFIVIAYHGGDKLYIPVDRLSMVQKYIGLDGVTPVIDKMGGKSWQRAKEKAKKSVEKIAGELLNLYASRKVLEGFAYSPPDAFFKDFEAGFPYEETPDQLKAIEDVLEDMEASSPMDRLVCGDVGYGKTEVALRAAFKAVNDGKQAAILAPTTLLAEQHYQTFMDRFKKYPVAIDCLSRFRSSKEQREILQRLASGRTDIVIGTHRLLQKDVCFKDLGLIVIDEEQRFGVKHKEKLKKSRKTVDVLSLTATPIPRTLHMSLMGVRDISVIQTPPEFRRAIISYISEFDPAVIAEAIRKEISRQGQVFFVHNNIHTIWNIAKTIKELVPEIRLGVAHGRLSEDELEHVMIQFLNKEIDVLVCTTIVESGLDIPNANTIIINRADRFGLAQIYQLRGRVGRSDEQAYAYLFIPKDAALTRDAQKRLKVLMEYSDLGAGFQIAMSDLRIRGGGAALGIEQSGHIAALGYDMFLKLLEEEVAMLKGERVVEKLEPEINIPVSVFIPESYIPDLDQRLITYRRLARMTELKDISDFKTELRDRYGELPEEAGNLLLKIMLKVLCMKAGVQKLDLTISHLHLTFSESHQKNPLGLFKLIHADPKRYLFTSDKRLRIAINSDHMAAAAAQSKNILIEIAKSVND